MTDPHVAAASATLSGQAAVIPVAGFLAALGVPGDLLAWACFGGLVALANTEPKQPPREGWRLALHVALRLVIAAGVGGVFAPIAAEATIALAAKAGVALTAGPVLLRGAAVGIGFGTAFLPELMRLVRLRLGAGAGATP